MKIGVLLFYDKINRGTRDNSFDKLPYHGFKYILSELEHPYEVINISQIKECDFVLCSLTSVMDVENLIYAFETYKPDKGRCKIIVGGFGCINIASIYDYIDIAVFGRAEEQINDIIAGVEFPNVWRKDRDVGLEGKYIIRQPDALLPFESMVGCRNKCYFCHYSWTRKYIGTGNYDPVNAPFPEDDWRGLNVENSGRYLTAWDGLSESTRFKVNKKISDDDIRIKIRSWYDFHREAAVNLKIYNIVGYPWETKTSIGDDLYKIKSIFKECDLRKGGAGNRVFIMMMFTPFSPEPFTPMELLRPNIDIIWRDYFEEMGRQVYKGVDIECFILPQINSSFTLAKRVMINRCQLQDRRYIQNVLKNKKIDALKSSQQIAQLLKYNGFPFRLFNEIDASPVQYLETFVKYKHINVD